MDKRLWYQGWELSYFKRCLLAEKVPANEKGNVKDRVGPAAQLWLGALPERRCKGIAGLGATGRRAGAATPGRTAGADTRS